MPSSTLTSHDVFVLSKIKDPEASASSPLLVDNSLPKDPHITSVSLYQHITQLERSIITSIQAIELQIARLKPIPQSSSSPPSTSSIETETETPLTQYLACIASISALIALHPTYASLRNNRAQALRRVYGDGVLLKDSRVATRAIEAPLAIIPTSSELLSASSTILTDLSTTITLLTPSTPYSPISPTAARTLSQAYTQRGAVYLFTSKSLPSNTNSKSQVKTELLVGNERREAEWSKEDFEETASRDFMMGGHYGNEVAKALAVASNPTAKLCGAIVKEAIRKEFGFGDEQSS